MKKIARLLFLFAFIFPTSILLSQDLNADFNTGTITGSLDYDKHFSIGLTGLDPTVEVVIAKVWNTSKVNKVLRKLHSKDGNSGGVIINDDVLGHELLPDPYLGKTSTLNTFDKSGKLKGVISFSHKLRPNNTYYLEFHYGVLRPSTQPQKNSVEIYVENSEGFKKVLEEIGAAVDDRAGTIDYEKISNQSTAINQMLQKELNGLDVNYRLPLPAPGTTVAAIDALDIEADLLDYGSALFEIKKQLEYLKGKRYLKNSKKEISSFLEEKLYDTTLDSTEIFDQFNFVDRAKLKAEETIEFDSRKSDIKEAIATYVEAREIIVPPLLEELLTSKVKTLMGFSQTFQLDDAENRKSYAFVDLGYGLSGKLAHFSQLAISIHLRPVKPHIPMKQYSAFDYIANRFALLAGITLTGDFESPTIKGILGENRTAMVGFGIRIVPGLKLNAGWLGYYEYPSPIVDERNLRATPFISAAVDFNITPAWKELQKKK